MSAYLVRLVFALGIFAALPCAAQDSRQIFSDLPNGEAVFKASVGDALRESKRILIHWGLNTEPKCRALDDALLTDAKFERVLNTDFLLVRLNSDLNRATADALGV